MNVKAKNPASINSLPSYKNPPVNEVVCGVRFHPSDKLRMAQIGFLWKKFKDDYPNVEHAAPLVSAKGEMLVDPATGAPLPRTWFINKIGNNLIQFQGDRFYFNWRRIQDSYPRYGHIIENFEALVRNILDFYNDFQLGKIEPVEYELTYVNHIVQGEGWDTIDDLDKVFRDFNWKKRTNRFLPNPDNVGWNISFLMPEGSGRLNVSLKRGIRTADKKYLLVLELKAIGMGEFSDIKNSRNWFDISREWIVRGFTDLTTPEMHKIWERG
jgi:uncharacterized protein (TIGR04255 family)